MKHTQQLSLLLALSLPLILFSIAWAGAKDLEIGQPPDGPCPMGAPFARLADDLNLTDAQLSLLEAAEDARQALFEKERAVDEKLSPDQRREKHAIMMRIQDAYREEMRLAQPDFSALAEELKGLYVGDNPAEFNAMIEADAAFHAGLTDEQRSKLVEIMQFAPRPRGPHPR